MTSTLRLAALAAAFAALLVAAVARAEAPKLPETAADHRAMAAEYQQKATTWRAEAALHRQMAADYAKAHPDRKSGARNPWTVEMEKHCGAIERDAEQLAADAEAFARYHALRASELEGK